MKVLVIGGNRFVGLRLTHELAQDKSVDLNIVNRTGQAPHAPGAAVYKADRAHWKLSHIDRDWDVIVDFAAFNDTDVHGVLDYFRNIKRYIYISSVSVYDGGSALKESAFDAASFDLTQTPRPAPHAYQDGKRRAEAAFLKLCPFPTLSVRFPFLLGPDDYTRRLEFHVQRTEGGQPIYAPAPDSRFSVLHAEDACRFLKWSLTQDFHGPLNVAAATPLSLTQLFSKIEKRTGRKALLTQHQMPENRSPYGIGEDLYVDVDKLTELGFTARTWDKWLGELIEGASRNPASSNTKLH
ncbi:MAG: hypothetical protein KF799_07050 [Bdellovibrionales bacterium]|nr:hypothetical protein [Bdellovibrionales bacterium]